MYAVGRLGSYISRGVYTVSGPFHPFGGAVDIIVVEQQDGSYKSSPWYVRFGKFQGVLKTKEKVVSISIDGVEANFHMLLNHKGEAYFLREVDGGEEEESSLYPLSSGEEADGQSPDDRRPLKTQSFNLDAVESSPEDKIDKKVVTRSKSSQSRFLGLFGRKAVKDETFHEKEEGDASVARVSSLERAEIAADLLELQWSTSLSTMKKNKGNVSNLSSLGKLASESGKDLQIKDEQGLDQVVLLEETGSHNNQIHCSSLSDSEKLKCSAEESSADISCLRTHEKVVETSTVVLEGKCEIKPITSRVVDETYVGNGDHDGVANGSFSEITGPNSRVSTETCVGNADHDGIANGALSEITGPDSRVRTETCISTGHPYPDGNVSDIISDVTSPNLQLAYSIEFEASPSPKFPVEQVCNRRDIMLEGSFISQRDTKKNGVQSSSHCEMSDSSIVGLDDSDKRTSEAQYPANGGRGEVYISTEIPTKDTRTEQLAGDARLETELAQLTVNNCHEKNSSCSCTPDHNEMDLEELSTVTDSYTPILGVDSNNGSVDEVQSLRVCTISTSRDSGQQVEGGKKVVESSLQSELASSDNSKTRDGDSISTEVASVATSQSSEEEQFLIGDLDEYKVDGVQTVELVSPDHLDKENHRSISLEGTEAGHDSISPSYKAFSSSDKLITENPSAGTSRVSSTPISISRTPKAPGDQVGQLGESMPNMWFQVDNLDNHISASLPLSHSLDVNPKPLKWTLLGKDDSCINSNIQRDEQLAKEQLNSEYTQIPGELNSTSASPEAGMPSPGGEQDSESEGTMAVDGDGKPSDGDPSKPNLVSNGSWRLWPFSLRRTRSGKAKQPAPGEARFPEAENATESTDGTWEKTNELRPKRFKKIFRANTPTSEELSSLKLREGRNTITFTFKTGMLGKQQVDARIYLWKWNTRIVISDVDGTITKSDVLGQFMPMVGIDWCQIGVAHLFSAIKENGYQLLFLSARAIAQAYHTRQFLLNIKQDGKALPDGPIVISPDGLFPSLYREVIRRAPHEFKIACLEDIKALFPHDCNPFYAGFGNRDTDEVSYLKVGIPRGKIFIINPKGQVAVSRRVATKSYTCLHDLVHDMFPPTATEQEDFNSWNFWKLPPPSIDM